MYVKVVNTSKQQNKQTVGTNDWDDNAMFCGASDCETGKRIKSRVPHKQKKYSSRIDLSALRLVL